MRLDREVSLSLFPDTLIIDNITESTLLRLFVMFGAVAEVTLPSETLEEGSSVSIEVKN